MRYYLAITAASILLAGCEAERHITQFDGTVSVLVGSADSETGVHTKLIESGTIRGGMKTVPAEATDWLVDADWSMLPVSGTAATYRFNWTFTTESSAQSTGTSDITFDGKSRVVSVVNDQFCIAIDPRSLRSGTSPDGTPLPNPRPGPIWAE